MYLSLFFITQKKEAQRSKNSVMFKMVITSQTHFTVMSEGRTQSEAAELREIKNMMKDYTKDIALGRLEHEHAMQFLSASLVRIS